MKKLLLILGVIVLTSCGSSGPSERDKKITDFMAKLTAHSGENLKVVDKKARIQSHIIVLNQGTGEYRAYNIDIFNKEMDMATYMSAAGRNDIVRKLKVEVKQEERTRSYDVTDTTTIRNWQIVEVDEDGNPEYGYVDIEVSTTRTEQEDYIADITYYYGNGLTFDLGTSSPKDLQKIGAMVELHDSKRLARNLVENYELSETRALTVAKLLKNWNSIQRARSTTQVDRDAISRELLGTDEKTFTSAYLESRTEKGSKKYAEIIEQASKLNNVSTEHLTEIVSELVNK